MKSLLFCVLFAGVSAAPQLAPKQASISGQVIDAMTNEPIPGADVSLSDSEGKGTRVVADAQGRFMFPGRPPGIYDVTASKSGYLYGNVGQREPLGSKTEVDLNQGEPRVVTVRLWKPAGISGVVKDDKGRPLGDVRLRVLRSVPIGGRLRLLDNLTESSMRDATDEQGAFSFPQLPPGTFVVVALPGEIRSPPRAAPSSAASEVPHGYATTFYPDAALPAGAFRLTLGPGEVRADIDFTLAEVPLSTISGKVTGIAEGHSTNVSLHVVEPGDAGLDLTVASTVPREDGGFDFRMVPPGQYLVRVSDFPRGEPTTMMLYGSGYITAPSQRPATAGNAPKPSPSAPSISWAESDVTLDGKDLADLSLPLREGAHISGRIVFEGTTPAPSLETLANATMLIVSADRIGIASPVNGIASDGTFTAGGMPPGKYQVMIMNRLSLQGWTIRAMARDGRDISGEPIDLGTGDISGVVITYGDRPSALSGTVRNDRTEPVAGVSVLIFPADRQAWVDFGPSPLRLREVRTSRDGSYRAAGLIPGDYFAIALSGPPTNDWQTAARLETLAPLATAVHIGVGTEVQQMLRVRR